MLERQMGFVRVGLVYIVSGFGGNLASSLFLPRLISVGASGASIIIILILTTNSIYYYYYYLFSFIC
jgi:membrane associated rhomboid family serine protease